MKDLIERLKSKPEYLYSVSVLTIVAIALFLKNKKTTVKEESPPATPPKNPRKKVTEK